MAYTPSVMAPPTGNGGVPAATNTVGKVTTGRASPHCNGALHWLPTQEYPDGQSSTLMHPTHAPAWHLGAGVTHGVHVAPQAPSVLGQTHWLPEQALFPPQSAAAVHCTQLPAEHLGAPAPHLFPHVRQLTGSANRSTQASPHRVSLADEQLMPQTSLVQVATVLAPATGQSVAEQQPEAGTQVLAPAQYFRPVGQIPAQGADDATQVPLQT